MIVIYDGIANSVENDVEGSLIYKGKYTHRTTLQGLYSNINYLKHDFVSVTGSTKTSLITNDRKFKFFLSQTQTHINTLSNFTTKNEVWSATPCCISLAHW